MTGLRLLPERKRPPSVRHEANGVVIVDCVDASSPEGRYAEVGPGVKVGIGFAIGHFTTIGPGAVVGHATRLGTWSSIGPYSQVGNAVRFGQWSRVGMDCIVDSGVRLREHEYVRSGHRRHLSGETTILPDLERFSLMHHLYDTWKMAWTNEEDLDYHHLAEAKAYEAGLAFSNGLRAYLEERESMPTNPFISALESLAGRRLRPLPDEAYFEWRPEVRYPLEPDDEEHLAARFPHEWRELKARIAP